MSNPQEKILSYKSALIKLIGSSNNYSLSNDVCDKLSLVLCDINDKLISTYISQITQSNEVKNADVCNAIKALLPKEIQQLAIAAGSKAVCFYNEGKLLYEGIPTTPFSAESVKDAMKPFVPVSHPNFTLSSGPTILETFIFKLTKDIIAKASSSAKYKSEMKIQDMVSAVEHVVGGELFELADGHGSKNMQKYEQGRLAVNLQTPFHAAIPKKIKKKIFFKSYLEDVLEQFPLKAKKNTVENVEEILFDTMDRIAGLAVHLAHQERVFELSTDHLHIALKMLLPDDIFQYSVANANTSVLNYYSGLLDVPSKFKVPEQSEKSDIFKPYIFGALKQLQVVGKHDSIRKLKDSLYSTTEKIVDLAGILAQRDNSTELSVGHLYGATEYLLPKELSGPALANAQSNILKFRSGLLPYDEGGKRLNFSGGIKQCALECSKDVTVGKESISKMNELLSSTCKMLAKKAAGEARRSKSRFIRESDITRSMNKLFPGELRTHALARLFGLVEQHRSSNREVMNRYGVEDLRFSDIESIEDGQDTSERTCRFYQDKISSEPENREGKTREGQIISSPSFSAILETVKVDPKPRIEALRTSQVDVLSDIPKEKIEDYFDMLIKTAQTTSSIPKTDKYQPDTTTDILHFLSQQLEPKRAKQDTEKVYPKPRVDTIRTGKLDEFRGLPEDDIKALLAPVVKYIPSQDRMEIDESGSSQIFSHKDEKSNAVPRELLKPSSFLSILDTVKVDPKPRIDALRMSKPDIFRGMSEKEIEALLARVVKNIPPEEQMMVESSSSQKVSPKEEKQNTLPQELLKTPSFLPLLDTVKVDPKPRIDALRASKPDLFRGMSEKEFEALLATVVKHIPGEENIMDTESSSSQLFSSRDEKPNILPQELVEIPSFLPSLDSRNFDPKPRSDTIRTNKPDEFRGMSDDEIKALLAPVVKNIPAEEEIMDTSCQAFSPMDEKSNMLPQELMKSPSFMPILDTVKVDPKPRIDAIRASKPDAFRGMSEEQIEAFLATVVKNIPGQENITGTESSSSPAFSPKDEKSVSMPQEFVKTSSFLPILDTVKADPKPRIDAIRASKPDAFRGMTEEQIEAFLATLVKNISFQDKKIITEKSPTQPSLPKENKSSAQSQENAEPIHPSNMDYNLPSSGNKAPDRSVPVETQRNLSESLPHGQKLDRQLQPHLEKLSGSFYTQGEKSNKHYNQNISTYSAVETEKEDSKLDTSAKQKFPDVLQKRISQNRLQNNADSSRHDPVKNHSSDTFFTYSQGENLGLKTSDSSLSFIKQGPVKIVLDKEFKPLRQELKRHSKLDEFSVVKPKLSDGKEPSSRISSESYSGQSDSKKSKEALGTNWQPLGSLGESSNEKSHPDHKKEQTENELSIVLKENREGSGSGSAKQRPQNTHPERSFNPMRAFILNLPANAEETSSSVDNLHQFGVKTQTNNRRESPEIDGKGSSSRISGESYSGQTGSEKSKETLKTNWQNLGSLGESSHKKSHHDNKKEQTETELSAVQKENREGSGFGSTKQSVKNTQLEQNFNPMKAFISNLPANAKETSSYVGNLHQFGGRTQYNNRSESPERYSGFMDVDLNERENSENLEYPYSYSRVGTVERNPTQTTHSDSENSTEDSEEESI